VSVDNSPVHVAAWTVALFTLAVAAAAPPSSTDVAIARVDELWQRRDEPAILAQTKQLLDQALAVAPADYGLLWRAARWYFWKSDDPALSNEEKSKLGKEGWALAERAVAINPGHVAGHYWAAVTMGNYALGLGILRAMSQGIEGKFRHHLGEAERLDARYEHGGVTASWGGLYAKLPWPKHDEKKAIAYFRKTLEQNPDHLRVRVLWAELHLEEDRPAEAKRLLEEVLAAPGGKYDGPEEKRAKVLAEYALRKVAAATK
jgi:tetratricopeptide (TPR) repeat protein